MTSSPGSMIAGDIQASALGFGCASLGSRVSSGSGLTALKHAFDAGVTWFDVAPAYGDGQAEELLGQFTRFRRDQVQIVTKVGLAPPMPSLQQRLLRPMMRFALASAPQLRKLVRRHRPATQKIALSPSLIATSLDESLRRLRTDHVDVLALHAVESSTARDPAIIAALEGVVRSGKARRIGVASSPEAAVSAFEASPIYSHAQFANNPFERGLPQFRAQIVDGRGTVGTHSVYGHQGNLTKLATCLASDANIALAFERAGYGGPPLSVAANFLADYAFSSNVGGVVIVSMFKRSHLDANLSRLNMLRTSSKDVLDHLAELVSP